MSECCQRMAEYCRKAVFFLAHVVATVGSVAYCFYLIWLLAYLKDSGYYWFFAFIPGGAILPCLEKWFSVSDWLQSMAYHNDEFVAGIISRIHEIQKSLSKNINTVDFVLPFVLIMLMCSFTLLTRQGYYHLSANDLIGPQWVIMSLKGSIVFFVSDFFARNECRLQKILERKDLLTRGLLDFVDIFNLVELLSFNKCVGIGSSVTEESSLEMAIQAFCTMSLAIIFLISDEDAKSQNTVHAIYMFSPIFQNIPFLVIRIIVWAWYNVFSLGIVFFICVFLVEKECRLQKILEDKEILNRGLLDFVDIFNMVELLSLNHCVGIGSSVTEGSSLEMAIQAFCTMSILIIGTCVYDPSRMFQEDYIKVRKTAHCIYIISPSFQNFPFLVIRIIVWARHGVYSLGFLVKNVFAIVVCCAEIYTKKKVGANDEQPNNVNSIAQSNFGNDNDSDDGIGFVYDQSMELTWGR